MEFLRAILSGPVLAFVVSWFLVLVPASAVHVKAYTKKDGTYVPAHERSAPNHTKNDNYSTKGNVNPYTGKKGTKPGDGDSAVAIIPSDPIQKQAPIRVPAAITPGTFKALKSGMTQTQLTDLLGFPKGVEGKGNYEIWTYPSGKVFFSPTAGVVAWREDK